MYENLIAIIEEPDKETFEVLISYFAIGDIPPLPLSLSPYLPISPSPFIFLFFDHCIHYSRAFRLYDSMQKQQIPLTSPVCSALLLSVPRTAKQSAVVAQLVRRGAALGLSPSRAALEHVVAMVPHDHMAEFTQLIQKRKAIEDAEEIEYQEAEKRKKEQLQRKQEEDTKKKEEEQKRKEEEQKRKEEQRRKDEEIKKQEEHRRKEEQQKRLEERNRKAEEQKRKLEAMKKKMVEKKKQTAAAKKQQKQQKQQQQQEQQEQQQEQQEEQPTKPKRGRPPL